MKFFKIYLSQYRDATLPAAFLQPAYAPGENAYITCY